MYTSLSVMFLLAGNSILGDLPGGVVHAFPWFGHSGDRRPRLMRSSPDISNSVGGFLRTNAEIFRRGVLSQYREFSVSLVAKNSTPADGATISEFPRQTIGNLPSWNHFFLRRRLLTKASDTRVFVHPLSQTALTVEPLVSHRRGESSFCGHACSLSFFRSFLIGSVAWKH